jgi:hypothetical protein
VVVPPPAPVELVAVAPAVPPPDVVAPVVAVVPPPDVEEPLVAVVPVVPPPDPPGELLSSLHATRPTAPKPIVTINHRGMLGSPVRLALY